MAVGARRAGSFFTQPCLEFTEIGLNNRKYLVSCSLGKIHFDVRGQRRKARLAFVAVVTFAWLEKKKCWFDLSSNAV